MQITETLYVTNRDEWRKWLLEHHRPKKKSGLLTPKTLISHPFFTFMQLKKRYVLAGLMVSQRKLTRSVWPQRFTPRRPKSNWSELNKERAKRLILNGKMTEAGLKVLPDLSTNLSKFRRIYLKRFKTIYKHGITFSNFPMFTKEFVLVILKKYENNPVNFKKGSTTF